MNTDVKAQWTAALRNGDREQGRGRLKSNDGKYCCLGVLCDLAEQAGVVSIHVSDQYNAEGSLIKFGTCDDDSNGFGLPAAVLKWSGLTEEQPFVGEMPLATLNDGGKTFAEIADLIDAYL